MSNIRVPILISALAGLSLLSCVSPSTTPTTEPATDPAISPHEIVANACAQLVSGSHTIIAHYTLFYDDPPSTSTHIIQTSGNDYHTMSSYRDGSESEWKEIDGIEYYQLNGPSAWQKIEGGTLGLGFPHSHRDICPDLESVTKTGETTINIGWTPTTVTHFTSTSSTLYRQPLNPEYAWPTHDEYEYWIDSAGQLVQFDEAQNDPFSTTIPQKLHWITATISRNDPPIIITVPDLALDHALKRIEELENELAKVQEQQSNEEDQSN